MREEIEIKQAIDCLGDEMKKAYEQNHKVQALAIEEQIIALLWVVNHEGNGDLMQATEAEARIDETETSEIEQVELETAEPTSPSQPEFPREFIPESIEHVPEEYIPKEMQVAYNRKTEFKHFF